MKELENIQRLQQKQSIESIIKKKKQVEYKYEGTINPYRGHRVFEINLKSFEIKESEFVKHENITWFEAIHYMKGSWKKEIVVNKDCVYVSALNERSALKRFENEKGSAIKPKGDLNIQLY